MTTATVRVFHLPDLGEGLTEGEIGAAWTMVGVGTGPRRMNNRSSPRCHTSRVTSEASRTSTICRSASTSRDVVLPSTRTLPVCALGADSVRIALRLVANSVPSLSRNGPT